MDEKWEHKCFVQMEQRANGRLRKFGQRLEQHKISGQGCTGDRERIASAEAWSARGRARGDAPIMYIKSGAVLQLLIRKQLVLEKNEQLQ